MSDNIEFQLGESQSDPASSKKRPLASVDKEPTLLEELAEELAKKIERPEIKIEVPSRPGVSLLFSPNITQFELRKWRKAATDKKTNELDSLKWACQIIGHTCTGILIRDELVMDEDGAIVTFGSPIIRKMTNTTTVMPDAVQAFFVVDPHAEATAMAVLEAAGYGEEVTQTENPTKTLSES